MCNKKALEQKCSRAFFIVYFLIPVRSAGFPRALFYYLENSVFIICETYCTGTSSILSLNFSHAFMFLAGRTTRLKPIFRHSFTRLSAKFTPRTSPVSPTSPNTAVYLSTGIIFSALARAAHTHRSALGSLSLMPPIALR